MMAEEILERLSILPLDSLRIHEQTIDANFRALRETMLNLGRIVDPLIVDAKHRVVLDGNHRRQVLDDLKCENAVCQMVDYGDPSIQVKGWYLAVPELDLNTKYSLGGEMVDMETGMAALGRMDASMLLVQKNGKEECALFKSPDRKLGAILEEQKRIISKIPCKWANETNGNGDCVAYIEDVRAQLFLEKNYSVLYRRPYTKEEIVKEAAAGRPLPPKSTRHIIPNRIIRLNFHLGYLNEDPQAAWKILTDIVRKRVKHGSARYYTEPVIVMY